MAWRSVFQTAPTRETGQQQGQRLSNSTGMVSQSFPCCPLSMAGMAGMAGRHCIHLALQPGRGIAHSHHTPAQGRTCSSRWDMRIRLQAVARSGSSTTWPNHVHGMHACECRETNHAASAVLARCSPLAVDGDAKVEAEGPHAGTCTAGQRLAGHFFQKRAAPGHRHGQRQGQGGLPWLLWWCRRTGAIRGARRPSIGGGGQAESALASLPSCTPLPSIPPPCPALRPRKTHTCRIGILRS